MVANVDLAPTFMQAATLAPSRDPPMDGRSLLEKGSRRELLFEYYRDRQYPLVPSWASIRTNDLQYVEYFGPHGRVTFREYYDLRKDPFQLHNLLHDGDRANDPDFGALASEIRKRARCNGMSGPRSCP